MPAGGGDEFLLLLPATDGKEALKIAERLRSRIESMEFFAGTVHFKISMSFGITEYDHKGERIQPFIDRADKALYECKKKGKNRVVFIPSA